MKRTRLAHLALLGSAAALVGCGYSPRAEFFAIRSQSVAPTAGDGTRIVTNDLPTTTRGLGRADTALAERTPR